MALKPSSIFESDQTGMLETISLQPFPPAVQTSARMTYAFYGTDASGAPIQVPVAPNGLSVSVKMLAGINVLTITFISQNSQTEYINLVQSGTILVGTKTSNHSGACSLFLRGL